MDFPGQIGLPIAELERHWREQGLWRDKTLNEAFADAAQQRGEAQLTLHSPTRPSISSLAELRKRGLQLAGALSALGLVAGDVVALQLPNWQETALLYHGAAALGCIVLPIIPSFGSAELTFILRDSRASVLFVPDYWRSTDYLERIGALGDVPGLKAVVVIGHASPGMISWDEFTHRAGNAPVHDGSAEDVAFIVYTSGSTADPKGVRHTSNSILSEIYQAEAEGGVGEVTISPYPAGHIAGALLILGHAAAARDSVGFDIWDPAIAAKEIERLQISASSGTPYHYRTLFDAAATGNIDLRSLKVCGTGGASVPESLIARAQALGLPLVRRYGMSEQPTVTAGRPSDSIMQRTTTDGRCLPGCEVMIVDDDDGPVSTGAEGEVATRGPELFLGYTDSALDRDCFLPGRWYRSGDVGRLDEQGHLTIIDRKKDIIIRGGENISSREVENLLLKIAGVREAAAVAMPDAMVGERVCAFVCVEPGETLTLDAVDAAFRAFGVARHKTPERLILIDDFPRTAAGKVHKPSLRRQSQSCFSTTLSLSPRSA